MEFVSEAMRALYALVWKKKPEIKGSGPVYQQCLMCICRRDHMPSILPCMTYLYIALFKFAEDIEPRGLGPSRKPPDKRVAVTLR